MLKELRPALVLLAVMTIVTGIAYPLAVTGLSQALFPWQARGSLIEQDGRVIGSAVIGQSFAGPAYFWGRPSATTGADPADPANSVAAPYNAANSMASNLAPTSRALAEGVAATAQALRAAHPDQKGAVPMDLATASASGLDPHITPAAAAYQVKRVALARRVAVEDVQAVLAAHVEGRELGMLGEPRVNVLKLNLALDRQWPLAK